MAQSYKTLKENFVSNLSGGSIIEINYVTAVAPAAYLLWSALQSHQGFFEQYGPASYLADFLLNVGAILFATTLYSSTLSVLHLLLLLPAIVLFILLPTSGRFRKSSKPSPSRLQNQTADKQPNPTYIPVRPFITAYRGGMMIITCISILAVDFKVFPRRFAKVETWGTSLMDIGVGSFVFCAGLMSAKPIIRSRLAGKASSLGTSLWAALRTSLPLFILGFVRLYSVKGLDYAEHVTEYGVHWNFFFTLAFLPPFVALCHPMTIKVSPALVCLVLGGMYDGLLEFTNLKAYMISAPRTNLLNQNREGLFSLLGYLGIFLIGQTIGFSVFAHDSGDPPLQKRQQLLLKLLYWSSILSALTFFLTSFNYGFNLRISRRLANFPYVLWVSAFNTAQITAYCMVETVCFPGVYSITEKTAEAREVKKATSSIVNAFNRNGLAIFLLANLMTGVINLTLDTLHMSHLAAMGVLICYSSFLTTVAVLLDRYDMSLKL